MFILFSSKTVELTERLKSFLMKKLLRLKKFSSSGIRGVNVVIDRVKRKGRTTSAASVELIADIRGRKFAFSEVGENVYQAFYRVYGKLDQFVRKELKKSREA